MVFCPTCHSLVILGTSAGMKSRPNPSLWLPCSTDARNDHPWIESMWSTDSCVSHLATPKAWWRSSKLPPPSIPMSATRRASVAAAKIDALADHLSATERNNGRRFQTQRLPPEALREASRRQREKILESPVQTIHQPGGCVHEIRAFGASERRSCGQCL